MRLSMLSLISLLALDTARLSHGATLGRLGVALGLGAVIGLQREIDGHDAGLRTHVLLTIGSALFGMLSVGAFSSFVGPRADTNIQVDVTRIASYLVAGVGFLAGGAIVKSSDRVKGLTTAASLWVSAGIGLAAGLGFLFGAVVTAVATLVVLMLDKPLSRVTRAKQSVNVHVVLRSSMKIGEVVHQLQLALQGRGSIRRVHAHDGQISVTVWGIPIAERKDVVALLESREDVVGLSYDVG